MYKPAAGMGPSKAPAAPEKNSLPNEPINLPPRDGIETPRAAEELAGLEDGMKRSRLEITKPERPSGRQHAKPKRVSETRGNSRDSPPDFALLLPPPPQRFVLPQTMFQFRLPGDEPKSTKTTTIQAAPKPIRPSSQKR